MSTTTDTPPNVWSATPTPFTEKMALDKVAVRRLIEHHIRLGVTGLFVLGTCGEGAWMTDHQRREMVETVVKHNAGRMRIAVQVTDNSAARILDNMHMARQAGADVAVIAPPYFLANDTPRTIKKLYLEAIRQSPLPVGIYDRGRHGPVVVPDELLKPIYSAPEVVMVKDSSLEPQRRDIALEVRQKRPELLLLNGYEFDCVQYLQAGYDGLLLGGGIFNGYIAGQIMHAVAEGRLADAEKLQKRMNRIMWDVYGGKQIKCWLSGQKRLLVEMGVFRTWRNYPDYPLTAACERAIMRAIERDADVLTPWKAGATCRRK